jgi:integrase
MAAGKERCRMVEDLQDPRRTEPPFLLSEREMLEAWLEFHRTTLSLKCEGLDDAGRKRRAVPTSKLSLHGLVRHLAEVERNWFRRVLLGDRRAPPIWGDPAVEDSELVPLDDADWEGDLAAWQAECDASRAAARAHGLDDTGLRHGEPCSLRWIYVHMIEEYARHNGHADLSVSSWTAGSAGEPAPWHLVPRRAHAGPSKPTKCDAGGIPGLSEADGCAARDSNPEPLP